MIRGHIDFVSRYRVEGWVYSDRVPLAGSRILAFVHDDCVGAGVVDVFRGDLVAAGLGDGIAGFGFSIFLKPSQDQRVIDIRLDGGNALIRQAHTCLIPRDEIGADQRRKPRDARSLSWMRARGWLTHEQHETLRVLGQFGAYSQGLRLPSTDSSDPLCLQEVTSVVGELLQLHMHVNVLPIIRADVSDADFPELRANLHAEFPALPPVIALWSAYSGCLNVVEGSHLQVGSSISSGGIDYEFGKNRILWLNLDAAISVAKGGLSSALVAFIPSRIA